MEKEIRNALCSMRGSNASDLVRQYCRDTIVDEIGEMIYDGLADVAFLAASKIEEKNLAGMAARKIASSSAYQPDIKQRAAAFLKEE